MIFSLSSETWTPYKCSMIILGCSRISLSITRKAMGATWKFCIIILSDGTWNYCVKHEKEVPIPLLSKWVKYSNHLVQHESSGMHFHFIRWIIKLIGWKIVAVSSFELPHDKTNKMTCAPSFDSDQPGHPPSLFRVFACAQWVAKDPSFLHADSEDWSDLADAQADLSLRWAHMPFCWFCHEAAHLSFEIWNHCVKHGNSQMHYHLIGFSIKIFVAK